MLDIKRIPELTQNTLLPTNGLFPWYDPLTDETYRIPASTFLSGLFNPSSAWNPVYSYDLDEVVGYTGQVWISLSNGNLGNPPGPASAFWILDPDPAPVIGGLTVYGFDTSGAITLDCLNQKELAFVGGANISEAKVWSLSNFANLVLIPFIRFTLSAVYTQTLPVGSKMAGPPNAAWDDATKQWTPIFAGSYQARVTYQGSQPWWNIDGPM